MTARIKNIRDKVEDETKEKADFEAKEAARDMTYEEFKEKFVEHIEGRAANERNQDEGSDEDGPAETNEKSKQVDKKQSSAMEVSGRASSQAASR